jgi:hypothetical protein
MKNLSIAFIAALSLLSFAACKKSGGGGSGGGDYTAKLTDFKNRMCECKDAACASKVTEDMTKWSQEWAKNSGGQAAKMSEADAKKTAEITTEMGNCSAKIQAAAAPPATPPADPAAAPPADPAAAPPADPAAAPAAPPADPAAPPADKPK